MKMEDRNYEYEEDLDILYINNNQHREKVIENLVLGNIVIDFGEDGKVLGKLPLMVWGLFWLIPSL